MNLNRRTYFRTRYFSISLLIIGSLIFLDHIGIFTSLNHDTYDCFFRLRGARSPHQEIVIVAIDEHTLKRLGRWPIARSHYAKLLERLENASVVGFDLLLTEPSPDDEMFLSALRKTAPPVLPTHVLKNLTTERPAFPYPDQALGHVHVDPCIDGVVRSLFHFIQINRQVLPSFSAVMAGRLGSPRKDPDVSAKRTDSLDKGMYQKDRMLINFYGGNETYPHISLADVLTGDTWSSDYFKDKIVLVGATAAGLADFFVVPFSIDGYGMAGVELHANILNNLLDNTEITSIDSVFYYGLVLVYGLCCVVLFCFFNRPILLAILSLTGLLVLSYSLFLFSHLWLAPLTFITVTLGTLVCAHINRLENLGTALRQADQDWHDTFYSIQDALVVQHPDGTTSQLNQAAQLLGETILKNLLPQRTKLLLNGAQLPEIEYSVDPATDSHLEIRSYTRRNNKGEISGVIHVVRDITEKLQITDQRDALQDQLIQAQKMEAIGTMAGGIAHDFNNLLSPIVGYSELALNKVDQGSDIHSMIMEIYKASQRAKDLIKQILGLSRKDLPEAKQRLPLQPIVTEALQLSHSLLPSSIDIRTNFIDSEKLVYCSPTQIHQIVMNLCTNAYHAMADSGGVLEIELMHVAGHSQEAAGPENTGKGYMCLSIRDTGCGMDQETIERIFDPYFTTKPKGKGTGLGLAVVRGIVEAHGGLLDVSSYVEHGTTFRIYFPVVGGDNNSTGQEETERQPHLSAHILVVDDDPAVAGTTASLLESYGYSVTKQTSSHEAVEEFKNSKHRFDLLVTDLTMPRMNGLDLVRNLRTMAPRLPVILCTGQHDENASRIAESLGIKHILLKPVSARDVADAVKNALQQ